MKDSENNEARRVFLQKDISIIVCMLMTSMWKAFDKTNIAFHTYDDYFLRNWKLQLRSSWKITVKFINRFISEETTKIYGQLESFLNFSATRRNFMILLSRICSLVSGESV
jgi:hypothetical protein